MEDSQAQITRAELMERLAEVSHHTWMRQKSRDKDEPHEHLDPAVTSHDRERAEDTVAELERLGLFPPR